MLAILPWAWWLVVVCIVAYVALALHTGLAMGRHGRRWWVWFLISICLTEIPAAVVAYLDYARPRRLAGGGRS